MIFTTAQHFVQRQLFIANRLDAESYEDQKTDEFIREHFLPVNAHIKEHPAWFHRFDAVWTPTVLLLDAAGKERVRLEGYLPTNLWPP